MKLSITRFIDCHVPTETCNFKCPYCYIGHKREFERKVGKIEHTPEEIRKALSMQRLGGCSLINFCAGGETLLGDDILPIVHAVLEEGHVVQIVTNGSVSKRFDEIAGWDGDLLSRLFIKFSFHYSELKRLNLIDPFFKNIVKVKQAGCSFTLEVTPGDELIPYIDEMKDVSMRYLGALPHVTVARNEKTARFEILTKYPEEEYRQIWGQFESPLFDLKMRLVLEKRNELCYAGEWSFFIHMGTGELKQCYRGAVIDNIYDEIDRPLHFRPIKRKCPESYCYNGHTWLSLGSIPDLDMPLHIGVRDRICADGSHWLNDTLIDFFSQKLQDSHTVYSESNSLPKVVLLGDSICEGYAKYVQERLAESTYVFRPKEIGRFSTYMLQNIANWAKDLHIGSDIDVVHFNIGLWDVVRIYGDEPLVSFEVYKDNLRRICNRIRHVFPNATLIFATTTSVRERFLEYSWLRLNKDIDRYNEAAVRVMEEEGVLVNDLHNATLAFDENMYIDGVHYTEEGYRQLSQHVAEIIEGRLPKSCDVDTEKKERTYGFKGKQPKFVRKRIEELDYEQLKDTIGDREVYIWGADQKGVFICEQLKENGISVAGFLDKTIASGDYAIIYKPEDIISEGKNDKVFIVVSMFLKHEAEILGLMRRMGFSEKDYYYPYRDWNFVFSDIGKRFNYARNSLFLQGRALAQSLDRGKLYFLLYGGHIGDEALALSWISAFRKNHYIRRMTVITSSLYAGLCNLYESDIDELIVWKKEDLEALRIYSLSVEREYVNILGANWVWFPLERKIPFPMDMVVYKTIHLGLPYDARSEYFISDDIGEEKQCLFKDIGLVQNKSVILIPYARSMPNIPLSMWEKLASILSKDYKVFTNIGAGEEPIKNTLPLNIPLKDIAAAVNYAGHAVAIRCGIADILALGRCKGCQIIYYVEDKIQDNHAKFCSLYVNGEESILCKNAIFLNGDYCEETVIQRIVDKINSEEEKKYE